MPANYIGGPSGSVLIGGVAYAFGKWRFNMRTGLPKVNNFTSAFQLLVVGLTSGTLSLEGPYDGGNMPLASGGEYVFTLRFSPAIAIVASMKIGEIGGSQDIEDAARLTVQAESNGTFTASVV